MADHSPPLFAPSCPPSLKSVKGVGDFKFQRQIGSGPLTRVYVARHLASGQRVCVKVYYRSLMRPKDARQVLREAELHMDCHHPHVIELYLAFFDNEAYYFVMEYAERGDLYQEMQRISGPMEERVVSVMVLQPLLKALAFMHNRGVAHRDIKPDNVLFKSDKTLKVCDLGLSIDLRDKRPSTRLGTLMYTAPEVLTSPDNVNDQNERNGYDERCDVWSLGILTHELLTGEPPFQAPTQLETFQAITQDAYTPPKKGLSPQAQDFLSRCLTKNPEARPGMQALLQHPFVCPMVNNHSASGALPPLQRVESTSSPAFKRSMSVAKNFLRGALDTDTVPSTSDASALLAKIAKQAKNAIIPLEASGSGSGSGSFTSQSFSRGPSMKGVRIDAHRASSPCVDPFDHPPERTVGFSPEPPHSKNDSAPGSHRASHHGVGTPSKAHPPSPLSNMTVRKSAPASPKSLGSLVAKSDKSQDKKRLTPLIPSSKSARVVDSGALTCSTSPTSTVDDRTLITLSSQAVVSSAESDTPPARSFSKKITGHLAGRISAGSKSTPLPKHAKAPMSKSLPGGNARAKAQSESKGRASRDVDRPDHSAPQGRPTVGNRFVAFLKKLMFR